MKKILFSLAALLMMVCTAVSLTSCGGDDEESTNVVCRIVWDYPGSETEPNSSADAIITQLDSKTNDIVGESFEIPYTKESDGTIKVNGDAIDVKYDALTSNSEIKALVQKLQSMGYSYVYIITKCGTKVLDYQKVAY